MARQGPALWIFHLIQGWSVAVNGRRKAGRSLLRELLRFAATFLGLNASLQPQRRNGEKGEMAIVAKVNAFDAELKAALTKQMSGLKIEPVPIENLKANPKNARLHSEDQILRIAQSMMSFGNTHPVVIDEQNVILSGHGRLEAAKRLKLPFLPAVRVQHLSPEQKRALALAENKLAELSSWDNEALAAELKELTASAIELNFDYSITGFDTDEIDQLIGPNDPPDKSDPADKLTEDLFADSAVTRPGDLWLAGSHLLYCGNALDPSSYRVLLQGGTADIVFAAVTSEGSPFLQVFLNVSS